MITLSAMIEVYLQEQELEQQFQNMEHMEDYIVVAPHNISVHKRMISLLFHQIMAMEV